jgi:pancreatic triacylglycerol lipase
LWFTNFSKMFKSTLFLVLVSLWGLGDAGTIAFSEKEVEADPSVDAISKNVNDLRYLHYTSANNFAEIDYNNRFSLEGASIRSDQPLVVIIDGFLSNSTSPMSRMLTQSFVAHGSKNVILLDWSKLSGAEYRVDNALRMAGAYLTVLGNVGPVGHRLAQFLELVEEDKGIPLSQVTLVGGSLGAHIAGACGSYIRNKYGAARIGRIVGLDPAGPFFSMQVDKDKRLHKGDALFVDIYHSNRGGLGDSDHDTGDVNIYVNGGANQPGCEEADQATSGVCSHTYAFRTFFEAFSYHITACPCTGNAECTCTSCSYTCDNPIRLGPGLPVSTRGRFHVTHEVAV